MDSIEADETIGARDEIADDRQPGVGRRVVDGQPTLVRTVGARVQLEAGRAQRLQFRVPDARHAVVDSIQVDIDPLRERGAREPDAMAESGLREGAGNQDAEFSGGTYVNREVVVSGNLVTARTWHDNPAWMREYVKLLNQSR